MIEIQHKEEGKKIIDLINELQPWDKADLIKYLLDNLMTYDEIEKYFIEGTGYIKYDDIDVVKEVIDNGYETDVLDEMSDWEILDYLFNSYSFNASSNLTDFLSRMHSDDITESIDDLNESTTNEILDSLFNNHKDKFVEIFKYMSNKLIDKK